MGRAAAHQFQQFSVSPRLIGPTPAQILELACFLLFTQAGNRAYHLAFMSKEGYFSITAKGGGPDDSGQPPCAGRQYLFPWPSHILGFDTHTLRRPAAMERFENSGN